MSIPTTARTTASKSILRQSISHFFFSLPSLLLLSLLLLSLHSSLLAGSLHLSSLPDSNPLLHSLLSSSSSEPPRFFHLSPSLPFPETHFSSSSFPFLARNPSPNSSTTLFSFPNPQPQKPSSSFADALQLIHLFSLLASAHSLAILAFILSHSAALAVVFRSVAAGVLSRPAPRLAETLRCSHRFVGFLFLKWAVRDALAQLLCVLFFAKLDDQEKLFRLFVRVKLVPLLVLVGDEGDELNGFLIVWGVLDFVASMVLVFVPWVVVVDDVRRSGRELVEEGVFLASLVGTQCVWIKCVEVVLGGRVGRFFLAAFGGRRFAMWAQAVFEVYFMVVWLVLYLKARRKEFELGGRRFGREELERCVDRL